MIKKIFFVFALAFTLQLISGCVDCHCGPIKDANLDIIGLAVKNMDNALPYPRVTNASAVTSANYGIQIGLATKQLVFKKQNINWSLIQTAQACSCANPNIILKQEVVSIAIFSNNDFDANHPKNTDLSAYFKAKSNDSPAMLTIAEHLQAVKTSNYKSSEVHKIPFYHGLFLQVPPSSHKKHQFRVKITLSDGAILEAETPEVELK